MLKVVITGPESTGKTSLARALAAYYSVNWAPEYARTYLSATGGKYDREDIVRIAKRQWSVQNNLQEGDGDLLICDTGLLVTHVWSLYKFGEVDPWISTMLETHPADLYLLCGTDVPWTFDPLREHPNERAEIYQFYLKGLHAFQLTYFELAGAWAQRFRQAVKRVDSLLESAESAD